MAKCKKGGCSCERKPKMLMALLVGLAVLVLTPSVQGVAVNSVMSSVLTADESSADDDGTYLEESDSNLDDDTSDNTGSVSDDEKECHTGDPCENNNTINGNKGYNGNGNTVNNNDGSNEGNGAGTAQDGDCKFDQRDAKRLVRELEQMIKREEKTGESTSDLESLLSEAEEIETVFESCSSLTWEKLDESRQSLHGENGLQTKLNVHRCWNELEWMEKDDERMEKDQERTKQHLNEVLEFADNDWSDKIEDYLDSMDRLAEIKAERKALMEESQCKIWTEEYFDEQMDLEDLRFEEEDLNFETKDFWFEFEEMQHLMWANRMFEDLTEKIAYAREHEYSNLPDQLKIKFDEMAEVAETLIAKGKECSEDGKNECLKEVQMRLEEIGRKAGKLFGAPEDFKDLGMDEEANQNLKNAFKDKNYGEATDVITYLLELDPSLVNKISDPAMVDKMFKILGHVPENMKGDFLSKVGDLKDAFDQAYEANISLGVYKDMILGHNYFGQALDDLIAALGEVKDGTTTVSELVAMLENFKSQSKLQEVSMGVSKFGDATSETWFYDAANMKELGISGKMENGKAMFDPSGTTTFSEMLKVLSEAVGIGQMQGTPSFTAANGHWSQGYYKAVENKGITLLDPNHKITRGEMARLMVELLGLPIQEGQSDFSDLQGHKYGKYIHTLNTYGVMQGDPNGTVRPDDTTNRAEAFTMAKNALEELQFAMDNYDLGELTEGLDDLGDEGTSTSNLMNNVMGGWKNVK